MFFVVFRVCLFYFKGRANFFWKKKPSNAFFCPSLHMGTSETIFNEVIRVSLAYFQGRALLLKPLNAYFCSNKLLDTSENVCCGVIQVSLTHFKHRAAFLGQNFEIFNACFRFIKHLDISQTLNT